MSEQPEAAEPFPGLNAAGGLRAGFQNRRRADAQGTPQAGARGYELQGEIARGGMGVIVKAFDRELGREVALKVLREELAHEPQLVRRFFEEARVTARLDHPGIVPVHALGQDPDGRAYFAMRLVRGRELRRTFELVRARAEGWNQTRALGVIQKVCEAMAYAHAQGVIHRDLKPANVMVGEFGEVYVMDWGLARAAGLEDGHDLRLRSAAREDESPIVTMDGEVLGTPCYMAPEQAQGRIGELGPRSDVYSVGAMLYHLLAGEMPYVPAGASVASRKVLAHLVEGPPRPLRELRADLPAELVAICEQAMARDPEQRYADMRAMAEDLRAYLEGRVVRAHESGAWAEAKKWVQRNRALSAALALAFVALVAGLGVSLALKAKSDHSAVLAQDERDRALGVASFLEEMLRGVAPAVALGRDTGMLRDMLDSAWARIERGELAAAPEAELRLMLVVGETYDDIAQYEKAEPVLRRAAGRAESLYHTDHELLARARASLGEVLRERGDPRAAEAPLRDALEMRRRLHSGDDADVAESLAKLGSALRDESDLAGAEQQMRLALRMRERLHPGDDPSVAQSSNNLGALLHARGELGAAEPLLRRAVEMQERLFQGDHPALASSLDNLASLESDRGDEQAAAALYRRALEMRRHLLPDAHPSLAANLNNLALSLNELGDGQGAEKLMREALEMERRLFPGDHARVAEDLGNLAGLLHVRGDLVAAEPLYLEAIEMCRRLSPGAEPELAELLANLAVLRKARGDLAGAEELYHEALPLQRKLFPGDHPTVATTIHNLGRLLEARGDPAGAEGLFREAREMQKRLTPAGHPNLARYDMSLAGVLQRKSGFAEADELLLEAAQILEPLRDARAQDYKKCLQAAIANATAWDHAEPEKGHADHVAEWRRQLAGPESR